MTVAYCTMHFPVPSEAFAAVELRALERQGAQVEVHALRPRPPRADMWLEQFRLSHLKHTHAGAATPVRGLRSMARRPGAAAWMYSLLLRHCWSKPMHLARSLVLLPRVFELLELIDRTQPDVLHLFWGHYPSLLGLLVDRYVASTHVSMSLVAYDIDRRFPLSIVLARRLPTVSTIARANIPVLESLGVPRDKIHVCHHGVEVYFDASVKGGGEQPHLLAVQRLVPQKHTEDVLAVFEKVRGRIPEATLTIVGDGPERPRLEDRASELGLCDSVEFTGFVRQYEVFQYMEQARVLLLMGAEDCLPNVAKEAMLRDCACVVARTRGIDELVRDGQTGFVVPLHDTESAAARVLQILEQPHIYRELTGSAREHVARHFDAEDTARARMDRWQRHIDSMRAS